MSTAKKYLSNNKRFERKNNTVLPNKNQGKYPLLRDLLLEPSWKDLLKIEFDKKYMKTLEQFIHQEWSRTIPIYPSKEMIFHAFNVLPIDKIKVVIVGQDPYYNSGRAMGMCFSVPKDMSIPPSLQNIFRELSYDLRIPISHNGNLSDWANQGMFLCNSILTVREGHV